MGGRLYNLTTYGQYFLSPDEYHSCRAQLLNEYYNYLVVSLLKSRRDAEFWDYHRHKLAEAGVSFSYSRLSIAVLLRCLRAMTHPRETFTKFKLTRAGGY